MPEHPTDAHFSFTFVFKQALTFNTSSIFVHSLCVFFIGLHNSKAPGGQEEASGGRIGVTLR